MTFQADANEEAEMIIRAIMQASHHTFLQLFHVFKKILRHDNTKRVFQTYDFIQKCLYPPTKVMSCTQEEVDKSIYSKMADDLETANKRIKKKKSKKIGQNPSAISA